MPSAMRTPDQSDAPPPATVADGTSSPLRCVVCRRRLFVGWHVITPMGTRIGPLCDDDHEAVVRGLAL